VSPLALTTCHLMVHAHLANVVDDMLRTLGFWITSGVQNLWGMVKCRNIQHKTPNVDRRTSKAMWNILGVQEFWEYYGKRDVQRRSSIVDRQPLKEMDVPHKTLNIDHGRLEICGRIS
jgi:hypothetical protein